MDFSIKVAKNPIGAPMPGANLFNFGLYNSAGTLVASAYSDETGLVQFSGIEVLTAGAHDFTVKELGAPAGWTADTTEYPLVVNAVQDPQGNLVLGVKYPGDQSAEFKNYLSTPTCGLVEFPELSFTNPGDYEYTIRETTPSIAGWDTDAIPYRVIIHVVDDDQGNLVATAEYPDGYPRFINIFTGKSARYVLSACKSAVGAPVHTGHFSFGIYDSNDNLIATAQNQYADETITRYRDEILALSKQRARAAAGRVVGNIAVADHAAPHHPKRRRRLAGASCTNCEQVVQRKLRRMCGTA